MNERKINGRKGILCILLGTALLAAFAHARIGALRVLAPSQLAAERYAGQSGKRFVQLSAFFHPRDEVSEFNILLFNASLEDGLRSSGNRGRESGFAFAYSASARLPVQSGRGTFPLAAVGTGGDFFLFHPYTLLSGSLMELPAGNGIILNDRAAWTLFGAVDVVGQPVVIGGGAYVVSGVVSLEEDPASLAALGGETGMVFVPFALLGTGVTCYETVLPEPVTGYGETLFARLQTDNTVTNSGRFSPRAIRKAICALPAYSMTAFSAPVPYWENAARNIEMRLILWTMLLNFILLPGAAVSFFLLIMPMAERVLRFRKNGRRIPVNAGWKGVTDP